MNSTSQASTRKLSQQSKVARAEIEKALSFHFQGNKADALKSLRKALDLEPMSPGIPAPESRFEHSYGYRSGCGAPGQSIFY